MKQIKLSDEEVELLRDQYEIALEEALKYVDDIKSILNKLGSPTKPRKAIETTDKPPKKRGRKPRVVKEKVETKEKKKVRRTRSDKGSRRKSVKPIVKSQNPVLQPAELKTEKPPVPKKKARKRRNFKKKGVVLKPLSKPLKKKPEVETPTTLEPAK